MAVAPSSESRPINGPLQLHPALILDGEPLAVAGNALVVQLRLIPKGRAEDAGIPAFINPNFVGPVALEPEAFMIFDNTQGDLQPTGVNLANNGIATLSFAVPPTTGEVYYFGNSAKLAALLRPVPATEFIAPY